MPVPTQARSINVKLRGIHSPVPSSVSWRRRPNIVCKGARESAAMSGRLLICSSSSISDAGTRSVWRSVSNRSSRGNGTSATSGIIASEAMIATRAINIRRVGCLHTTIASTTIVRNSAVDRAASNMTGPALSSQTHMARTLIGELRGHSLLRTKDLDRLCRPRQNRGAVNHGKKFG